MLNLITTPELQYFLKREEELRENLLNCLEIGEVDKGNVDIYAFDLDPMKRRLYYDAINHVETLRKEISLCQREIDNISTELTSRI